MSIRQRIEDDLAIWLLGALGTGFLGGVGTYKAIIEIARLEVITTARLEKLEELETRRKVEADVSKSEGSDGELPSAQVDMSEAPDETKANDETIALAPEILRFSEALEPFPEDYDLIRPGMSLSAARAAYPSGEITFGWFSVKIESGPFDRVVFYTASRGEDPSIGSIHFFYRTTESRQLVVRETLRKFGGLNHISESLGTIFRWPEVNGFSLELGDNSY